MTQKQLEDLAAHKAALEQRFGGKMPEGYVKREPTKLLPFKKVTSHRTHENLDTVYFVKS